MGCFFQPKGESAAQAPPQCSQTTTKITTMTGVSSYLDFMPVPIGSTNIVVLNHPAPAVPSAEHEVNDLDREIAELFAEEGCRAPLTTSNRNIPVGANVIGSPWTSTAAMKVPSPFSFQHSSASAANPLELTMKTQGAAAWQRSANYGPETKALHSQVPTNINTITPKKFFMELLRSRGYSTKSFSARACGYCTKPTELQVASYGTAVVKAIQAQKVDTLYALLTCGLSRNPCNVFSDGTLCMSIRRGSYDIFKCQLDAGASVQVADDFGRTPLHFCAWSAKPCFRTVEQILKRDIRMMSITDHRGKTPLDYLMPKQHLEWIRFLEQKKDEFWPEREEGWKEPDGIPYVVRPGKSQAKRIPDPDNALSPIYATMVSYGVKNITEVMELIQEEKNKAEIAAETPKNNSSLLHKVSDKSPPKQTKRLQTITLPPPAATVETKVPSEKATKASKKPATKKTTNKRKLEKDASTKLAKPKKVPRIIEARKNILASRSA